MSLSEPFMREYYDLPLIWGDNYWNEVQLERAKRTVGFLPKGICSVLDVGCGAGIVSQELMRRVPFVVGVDFASQPLLQVKKAQLQAVQGDACALPFPDKAFDAVVAGELIEHLNESDWPRVLIEIKRVSRRFVLLTVPFREVLEFDQAKCGYCYHIFSASRHKRSLDKSLMSSLLHPEFGVTLMQTFGPSLKRTPRQLVGMAQLFDGYMKGNSGGCMCPQCGNTESFIQNDWARLIFLKIPSRLLPLPKFPIWMAALYEKRPIG